MGRPLPAPHSIEDPRPRKWARHVDERALINRRRVLSRQPVTRATVEPTDPRCHKPPRMSPSPLAAGGWISDAGYPKIWGAVCDARSVGVAGRLNSSQQRRGGRERAGAVERNRGARSDPHVWRLNAEKAPVSEFAPIIGDDFALVAVDASGEEVVRFDGMRGLEEHQAGKEVYFDQRFTLRTNARRCLDRSRVPSRFRSALDHYRRRLS